MGIWRHIIGTVMLLILMGETIVRSPAACNKKKTLSYSKPAVISPLLRGGSQKLVTPLFYRG